MTEKARYLNASTVIESLRDSGYNNTAYALAELIDNSIQAKADRVEVGFIEKVVESARKNYNVSEIIIFDNGVGMTPDQLRLAMQFGGSLNRKDKHGMGKFGMGLPSSSISQGRRVDVWSWVNGGKPHHTYLDIDEMKGGKLEVIPDAEQQDIPKEYKDLFAEQMPQSGTLVKWSKLDRLNWKMGSTNFKHSEYLVGRMYRKYLSEDIVKINATTYRMGNDGKLEVYEKNTFQANDPMYLMKKTSLPELPDKYKGEAFFELVDEATININYTKSDGEEVSGDVVITTSLVKRNIARHILNSTNSSLGSTVWGKHCAKNIGVSIVRAGRELVLRNEFIASKYKTYTGRFMGIEVSFPPTLDEVFGVTNNKQDAVKFRDYETEILSEEAGYDTEGAFLEALKANNDPFYYTLLVIRQLTPMITDLQRKLDLIVLSRTMSGEAETTEVDAEERATQGAENREEKGGSANSGDTEMPEEEDIKDILVEADLMDEEAATTKAAEIIKKRKRFFIESAPRDSDAFFDVQTSKGLTLVVFNTNHVFYSDFIEALPSEKLEVMKLAIAGFAQVMNETTSQQRRRFLDGVRREWGRVITDFIDDGTSDNEF